MKNSIKALIAVCVGVIATLAIVLGVVVGGKGTAPKVDREASTQAASEEITLTDSAGNTIKKTGAVTSVVALNKNAAEMITGLGKGAVIKGISDDTKYPETITYTEKFGTEENPNIDAIIQSKPEYVVTSTDAKDKEAFTRLKNEGIQVVMLDLNNVNTLPNEVTFLGDFLDVKEVANNFNYDIKTTQNIIKNKLKNVKKQAQVYYETSKDYTTINSDSLENALLSKAMVSNVASDLNADALKVNDKFIASKKPNLIVKVTGYEDKYLTSDAKVGADSSKLVDSIKKRKELKDLAAIKDNKVLLISERVTNTPLGQAMAPLYIAKLAYPEELKNINPDDYLQNFLDKYWGSKLEGSLAYSSNGTLKPASKKVLKSGPVSSGVTSSSSISKRKPVVSVKPNGTVDLTGGKKGDKEIIHDSNGKQIEINKEDTNSGQTNVKKCIVINSSIFDTICLLGQEDCVMGVGDTTTSFASTKEHEKYGNWKSPDVEKIIAAKPDIVFGYASWLDSGIQKQLEDAGIVVLSYDLYVPSQIPSEIISLGKVLACEGKAQSYVNELVSIQSLIKDKVKNEKKISAYWEGYTDYTSVGAGSGGTEILSYAQVNSLTKMEPISYPKINDEWILTKNPEIVVKMVSTTKDIMGQGKTEVGPVKAMYDSIINRPGWSSVSAVTNRKVLLLDGTIGTSPLGSAIAPLYIAKVAYPEAMKNVNPDAKLSEIVSKYYGISASGYWSYYEK